MNRDLFELDWTHSDYTEKTCTVVNIRSLIIKIMYKYKLFKINYEYANKTRCLEYYIINEEVFTTTDCLDSKIKTINRLLIRGNNHCLESPDNGFFFYKFNYIFVF